MDLATQKEELMRTIQHADEKLVGLIIALASEYNRTTYQFSDEELAEFHRRREDYLKNPDSAIPMEEALNRIRHKNLK